MSNVGGKGIIEYSETLVADNISTASADGIAWLNSSDGGTAFARAVAAARGLHVAGITAATNAHLHEFAGDLLQFFAQNGYCMVEVLMQLDIITTVAFNFGFNDDQLEDGDTLPVELSGVAWTSNAATFCGLVFDTNADNDEVHCFWVDDDIDTVTAIANLRMRGASLEAAKWCYMRVELHDRGSGNGARAVFHLQCNGKTFEKTFDTTVDRDVGLCWYLGVENRDAVAHAIYILAPGWEQAIDD